MAEQTVQQAVREALVEMQRYLSDQLAPMMVADSIDLLMRYPPELAAAEIEGWIGAQTKGPGSGIALSDYIFHAVKKIYLMSEFDLIDKKAMAKYIGGLCQHVLAFCPEEDRQLLRDNLGRLGKSETATAASSVEVIHRQVGGKADGTASRPAASGEGAAPATAEVARGVKQFSLLMERLGHESSASGVQSELRTQALATAAVSSRNGVEFRQNMSRLSDLGVDARMAEVLRSLGSSLPGWIMPVPAGTGDSPAPLPASRSGRALEKIVEMAANPEEGAERFNEMVQAAVEQFNEGNLVQAMTMLDLARRIVEEKKIDPDVVKTIRARSHQGLEEELLRRYADEPAKQETLRRVMEFFPALGPKELLSDLSSEPKRERRKLLLALLETYGKSARNEAFGQLKAIVDGGAMEAKGYYERNLIFLLRRIPPPEGTPSEEEIEILVRLASWDSPVIVLRETIRALSQIKNTRSEASLTACLLELEELIMKGDSAHLGVEEQGQLLDQLVSALAQLGTPNALRTVANHAFKTQPQLGDTMGRIERLGHQDLSVDKELVARLLKALDQELPSKVLGIVVGKKNKNIDRLISALAGTPAPAVRQKLEEIVNGFGDEPFGRRAAKALEGMGAKAKTEEAPSKTMTGDLELFGLPNLLQSLADSQVTGGLALLDRENDTMGNLHFVKGKIMGSRVGALSGEDAFYQLFERPAPGTFVFTSLSEAKVEKEAKGPALEIMPAILESMRRHDEFTQARALAPDDMALKVTGTKPTPIEDEGPAFMREIWSMASTGQTPEQCEAAVHVDSYRIRRLYAHWIEQGALAPK
jgi:vacuolar-type H+-ATPase subunit E/Vma4